ncbi:hypothetical protein ACWET9_43770 [Streptomyces sp. NPDC004059]
MSSIAELTDKRLSDLGYLDRNCEAHWNDVVRLVRGAFDRFRGVDPLDRPVWELGDLGLRSRTQSGFRVSSRWLDVTQIRQEWLRRLLADWVRAGRAAANGARASAKEPAAWKVEKQLRQEDNRRLRQEVERLKGAVRRGLGQQLDQFGAADLGTRVDELTAENQRLQGEHDQALTRVKDLTEQLSGVQDDLASARISLRRMIRAENAP